MTAPDDARLDRARRNLAALESSPHRDNLGKQIANTQALINQLIEGADS